MSGPLGHGGLGVCVVHLSHTPNPWDSEMHHIRPKEYGGASVPGNLVSICPTGHTNVHAILREWMRLGYEPSWNFLKRFGPADRALAKEGWRRIMNDEFGTDDA